MNHRPEGFEHMQTVDIHNAKVDLAELVEQLPLYGEILITDGDRPVARLSGVEERPSLRDHKPTSLGPPLRRVVRDDDLLDEMLRS
ncbi:MAG: hypothetical protein C4547_05970 [Phycisphaerales bacterium]|nr:MAG: hypothetical protein C4547_05970 [Phycisphaerales bacterium]